MTNSFYFYDLETTGIKPSLSRIMQFGGQRTNMELKPIGEPDNIFIKLTPDILPDPYAILVTGITPQFTQQNGITEAEFMKIFDQKIATPGTIFVGYNSVRFDDEFMRYLAYRNFYDPYEWQWKDDKSRWDLLDVTRMTRALRPEGIEWPVDSSGRASNRLELLTSANKLGHINAHDALADVNAVIELSKLIRKHQPKLFDYLLEMRKKSKIADLVNGGQPFVYSSGKYPTEFEKTTIVFKISEHPKRQGALVYDLRHNPDEFMNLSPEKLAELWTWHPPAKGQEKAVQPTLPVKTLQFNRCPAVAPLSVLDKDSKKRLKIDDKAVASNLQKIKKADKFVDNLKKALEIMDTKQQERLFADEQTVDSQLYDGFFNDSDRRVLPELRKTGPEHINNFSSKLNDKRLKALLPLYKARNYSKSLTSEEREKWEGYLQKSMMNGPNGLENYFKKIEEIKTQGFVKNKNQEFLLEELRLYGESLMPAGDY